MYSISIHNNHVLDLGYELWAFVVWGNDLHNSPTTEL